MSRTKYHWIVLVPSALLFFNFQASTMKLAPRSSSASSVPLAFTIGRHTQCTQTKHTTTTYKGSGNFATSAICFFRQMTTDTFRIEISTAQEKYFARFVIRVSKRTAITRTTAKWSTKKRFPPSGICVNAAPNTSRPKKGWTGIKKELVEKCQRE